MYSATKSVPGWASDDAEMLPGAFPVFPWKFFILAYAFSWAFWLLPVAAARAWVSWSWIAPDKVPILVAGAFGPFVAAFVLTGRDFGLRGTVRFAAQALRYRIPLGVLCLALFLCPALAAVAVYLHQIEGGPRLAWTMPLTSVVTVFLFLFFLGGSFQEEFGWAYAIDRMQRKYGTLSASALLGVLWAFWHLPLFFIPGLSQSFMPFWAFLLQIVALRIIAVWIYNASNRSILATLLFHTSLNLSMNLFPLVQNQKDVFQRTWIYFISLTVAAALPFVWRTARQTDRTEYKVT